MTTFALVLLLVPGMARAQGADTDVPVADDTPGNAGAPAERSPAGERELGARLGLAMGGGTTPGGVRLAGVMLYRMSDADWFDGSLGFTFGGRSSGCAVGADGVLACNHGSLGGAAADVVLGVRRFFAMRQQFAPYLRAGAGLRVVRFDGDELDGVAIPLVLGAGVRARLNDLIAVGGDAALEAGFGLFDRDLGIEPQLGLSVQAVIEFWL